MEKMKIVVSEIPDEGLDLDDEEDIESGTSGVVRRARLHVNVKKVDSDVYLHGDLRATLRLTCGRCLEDFSRDVTLPLELEFRPVEELEGDEKYELSRDELDTGFYREGELDLGEISREQVLLNLPMKPLCSEACKGICPRCGANLNVQGCGCDLSGADDRFRGLDRFFKGGKE
jgi:uncharacterized protein